MFCVLRTYALAVAGLLPPFLLVAPVSAQTCNIGGAGSPSSQCTISANGGIAVKASNAVSNSGGSGALVEAANGSTGAIHISTNSAISGSSNGIFTRSRGTGDISVMASGLVTATNRDGIYAEQLNGANVATVSVQANDVTAARYGVYARNRGRGDVSISTSGQVNAAGNTGLYAFASSGAGAGNVTVNAANVSGTVGIFARASGSGSVDVTTTGAIIGRTGNGIHAVTTRNRAVAANITINTSGLVTARNTGIFAQASGNGTVSVTAQDTVTSSNGAGITANIRRNAGLGDIIVRAARVNASARGVQVENRGRGAVDVQLTGDVTSANSEGVFLFSRNNTNTNGVTLRTAGVSANNSAVLVRNNARGATQVTTTGIVSSTRRAGIEVVASAGASTGDLSVLSLASVAGRTAGITATKSGTGNVIVDARAAVSAQTGTGLNVRANSAANTGNILVNAQAVEGRNGVVAFHNGLGAVELNLNDQVTGINGDGVNARIARGTSTGAITVNAQSTTGTNDGIEIRNDGRGAVTVNANGPLVGAGGRGLYARQLNTAATGDVVLNAGQVDGRIGIEAVNSGLGDLSINTTGTVTGTGSFGIRGTMGAATSAGTLTVNAVDVTGVSGVQVDHNGIGAIDLNLAGTVTATNGTAIRAAKSRALGTGDISIDAVSATGRSALYAEHAGTGGVQVTTTGAISSTAASGINIRHRNITTTAAVMVDAVDVQGSSSGIEVRHESAQGAINIRSTGQVTGTGQRGIYARHTRNGASGTIAIDANNVSGNTYGIEARTRASGAIDIATRGAVTANTLDGIYVSGRDTINVDVSAGSVSGGRNGISFQEINATLADSTVTIGNGATVSGGTGSGFLDGDVRRGRRATTLDIAGTLNAGSNGFAAQLGRGDDIAVLRETESITGIVDGGQDTDLLRFDYTSDRSFLASRMTTQFQNFENYEKVGPGTMTLTGTDSGLRDFAVLNGALLADADVANTNFTVASGALIGGMGRVGNLTINGTVSPGSAGIGTLTVNGDVTLNDNSTLSVQLAPNGTPDLLDVTGTATISSNATVLDVSSIGADYPKAGTFTVLQTAGGVTGQFARVQDGLPDLDFETVYDGDTVKLVYVGGSSTSDKSVIAAAPVAGVQTSLIFANAIERRARTLLPAVSVDGENSFSVAPRWGADLAGGNTLDLGIKAFAQGVGETLDVGSKGTLSGYRLHSRGLIAGFESSTVLGAGDAVFGIAAGAIGTDASVRAGNLEVMSYQAGLYGAYREGPFAMSGSATYAHLNYDITRYVTTGAGALTGRGDTSGDALSVVADVSYDLAPLLDLPLNVTLAPFLHGELHHATSDAFTESGLGVLDLNVASASMTQGVVETGLRFGAEHVVGDLIIRPQAMLGYRRLFGDRAATVGSRIDFADLGFEDRVAKQGRDQLLFGAGLTAQKDNLSFSLHYEGAAGDDTINHTGMVSFSLKF